jgi:hypothetical protein
MDFEIETAAGDIMHFSTGAAARRQVQGDYVVHVPTWGGFEEPDGSGGWRTVREFSLATIHLPQP